MSQQQLSKQLFQQLSPSSSSSSSSSSASRGLHRWQSLTYSLDALMLMGQVWSPASLHVTTASEIPAKACRNVRRHSRLVSSTGAHTNIGLVPWYCRSICTHACGSIAAGSTGQHDTWLHACKCIRKQADGAQGLRLGACQARPRVLYIATEAGVCPACIAAPWQVRATLQCTGWRSSPHVTCCSMVPLNIRISIMGAPLVGSQ